MYVYLCRIWLGDKRDVQLVSYQRDFGVWIFPGVRRVRVLLAIALKLNDVFLPFFFFFFFFIFESYDYCFRVQNLACSLHYCIKKTPNYTWETANTPSPSDMGPTAHLALNKKPLTS